MKPCPICKTQYDDGGNAWKKVCYDCYKNYKQYKRIQKFGYKSDIYLAHPSVTKEEMDQFIKDKGEEHGWGAEKYDPANTQMTIWVNSTNYD